MKKSHIRALAQDAYTILDEIEADAADGDAAAVRALQVLYKAPNDPESYLLMAEVAEENERFEHALMWINRGLLHHEEHAGLLFKKAALLLDGFEEIDEAFVILSKIKDGFKNKSLDSLKEDIGAPLLLDVYLLLTDCYRLKSNYDQAFLHAQLAHDIAPHDEKAILGRATAYYELGDMEKALNLLEPVEQRNDVADFFWQKAQILCAQGRFVEADLSFLAAFKSDKTRYHRPVRLDEQGFVSAFLQALLGLPREIRDFINSTSVCVAEVVPLEMVKESHGTLSPQICISVDNLEENNSDKTIVISLYKKNIENLARKKEEIKDLIASALLHDLGKITAFLD